MQCAAYATGCAEERRQDNRTRIAQALTGVSDPVSIAKLPLAKDVEDFLFDGGSVNETLVRDLASGNFLAHQRNIVLVGGAEIDQTGNSDLEPALSQGFVDSVSRSGDRIVARSLSVQPTIRIDPGAPVHVLVIRDLVVTRYDDKAGR
ncbi:MAG: hypothetical protein GC152_12085 [Alphaproteobacteria bacterium]|nr:hypothetical protein [Alphaproteobacteria bacterium]